MIHLENIVKTYRTKTGTVKALDNMNFKVNEGEFVVITGPSGSGKTTLLMTIAAMLRPTSGSVCVAEKNLYEMTATDRTKFRAETIGFVFQMFYLIPYLNVMENIAIAGKNCKKNDIEKILEKLNLQHRAYHKPSQLSVGEKQRTAVARVLINQPKIILADEPTGNLDPENANEIFGYLADFHRNKGTVILVSHGIEALKFASRTVCIKNGTIDNNK